MEQAADIVRFVLQNASIDRLRLGQPAVLMVADGLGEQFGRTWGPFGNNRVIAS